MNKSELIEAISVEADISKAAAERALNAMQAAVVKAVGKGERVTLVGFGTFYMTRRAARTGQNPQTGEKLKIPAANVPKFTAGTAFKEALNKRRR